MSSDSARSEVRTCVAMLDHGLAAQAGRFFSSSFPIFTTVSILLRVALELDQQRHALGLVFGQFGGDLLQCGDVVDVLAVDLKDHVFRLQGELGGGGAAAAANRIDQYAAVVLAVAFEGHHAGDVADGDAPIFQFDRIAQAHVEAVRC